MGNFLRILFVLIVIIGFTVLLIFAPWISPGYAEETVVRNFESGWEGIADGCGFNCVGCGVVQSNRAPFGYRVQIEYACGMIPADLPEYHHQADVFISIFGTVHGLPVP